MSPCVFRRLAFVALVWGLAVSGPSLPRAGELAPGLDACMEASEGVTSKMMDCLAEAHAYWDKRLNENYRKALDSCTGTEQAEQCVNRLRKAQRAWIAYRDAMGDVVFDNNGGGSYSRLAAQEFSLQETRRQAECLAAPE